MSRWMKWVLAIVILGAVSGTYQVVQWRNKEPERGSYAWQVKQFRDDFNRCGEFAVKREKARQLLAWPNQEDATTRFQNMDANLKAMTDRWRVDERICLRETGWPEEQIDRFIPVIEKERADEFCKYHQKRGNKMPNC